MPEIIDPVFAKTSQNARFLLSENERFGLVFVKTGSINSGTGIDPDRNVVRPAMLHRLAESIPGLLKPLQILGLVNKLV